jgi:hypothetical protein
MQERYCMQMMAAYTRIGVLRPREDGRNIRNATTTKRQAMHRDASRSVSLGRANHDPPAISLRLVLDHPHKCEAMRLGS